MTTVEKMTEQNRHTEIDELVDRRTLLKGAAAAGMAGVALTGTASASGTASQSDASESDLPNEAIVSTPGTEEYYDYVFEVTGELEKLESGEDRRHAVDDVIDTGDRVRVEGTVGTDDDRFAFSGDLVEVDVPSAVRIEIRARADESDGGGESDSSDSSDESDASEFAVLEDFETGSWPGDWTGETDGYAITDEALDGRFALEADGSLGYPNVRKPTADTPRGHTYTVRTVPGSSGAYPTLLTNVQGDASVMDDCYAAWLRTDSDELWLQVRSGGDGTTLESVPVRQSLDAGTEYILALDVGSDWVRARAFTSDGAALAATDQHTDTTHDGGTPGLYTGGSAEAASGTRFDQYARRSL